MSLIIPSHQKQINKELFKRAIQDLFDTLYKYNNEYFQQSDCDHENNHHFTLGDITDVCLDLINAYQFTDGQSVADLDKSIKKFLLRETGEANREEKHENQIISL